MIFPTPFAVRTFTIGLVFVFFSGSLAFSSDWPNWRGHLLNGVSEETDLISDWSLSGKNLIWRNDLTGRSTPVVLNGRIYALNRVGEGIDKQEAVTCFDVKTGKQLWQYRYNVYLTTVPFSRAGWADLVGDAETGYVFAHGIGGVFTCFDKDGKIIWQHSLTEELGRRSGYGGRTQTAIVDKDLVIISSVTSGWKEQAPPRSRYMAFDKRSGELVWIAAPGGRVYDMNTQSSPIVAMIDGRRMLIGGNADGAIEALDIRSGETIWRFKLSKRGINSQVAADGNRVFASHSEENLDEGSMGRVVCIDATGTGDITETHEVWRANQVTAGFGSPAIHDGVLYIIDNSANLHGIDTGTGRILWKYNLGTVGKSSPVIADGKLFATETNGTFHILKLESEGVSPLSEVKMMIGNRTAEIYSSPAVAYGRVFFVTEEGIYCLGDKNRKIELVGSGSRQSGKQTVGKPAFLQLVPAEVAIHPGEQLQFRVRSLDESGNLIAINKVKYSVEGSIGTVDQNGRFQSSRNDRAETGTVTVNYGNLNAKSRVRTFPVFPWKEDFESIEIGKTPDHWIGAASRFSVQLDGANKVLTKPFVKTGIQRSYVYIGKSNMSGYTIQADLKGQKLGRRVPDMGLVANRYTLALMGLRQELGVHSWISELRMASSVPFKWEPEKWYTMKMRVDLEGGEAKIRGKVWIKGEPEPDSWTVEFIDPHPNQEGTPGLFGQSYADVFYDNILVIER